MCLDESLFNINISKKKSQKTLLISEIMSDLKIFGSCSDVTPREKISECKDIINEGTCWCRHGCDFIDGRCIEGMHL